MKYGFALPEPEILDDGTKCAVTINHLLAHRSIKFDETQLPLGSDKDSSGSRSRTHTNPKLNRSGSRHTRSSGHVTGGIAVNGAGELLPPLIIFSSNAEKEENLAIQDGWVASFGKIKGKFGHPNYIERLPYVAVRKSGSMDCRLFRQLIEDTTFDLYPKETVALAIKVNDHGRLLTGPVMWTMDTGQGRMANLEDEGWDEWAEEMRHKGIIMNGLLPNSTAVMAIMDELFRAFKDKLRKSTHEQYSKKIKANAKQITRRKAEIARKIAGGQEVTDEEKAKTRSVVGLNPMDLGPILFGELTEDGYAAPDSPIAAGFTKEKVLEAHRKLGFDPYNRAILSNKALRHEIGQGEETDQTRSMRDLEKEYDRLKKVVYEQGEFNRVLVACLMSSHTLCPGFDTAVFDATLPTTTSIIRGETAAERAEQLAKTGKVAVAGNIYRCLGSMMYNSEELLLARKIARKNKEDAERAKLDKKKEKEAALYKKAEDAYLIFHNKGHLLDKLNISELQDIVRFLCCVESKGKGDTYSSHSVNKKKLKERIAAVQPVWTKYFDVVAAAEEDEAEAGGEEGGLEPINEGYHEIDEIDEN